MVLPHPERVTGLQGAISSPLAFDFRFQLADSGNRLFPERFVQAPGEAYVEIGRRGCWVFTNDSYLLVYPKVEGIIKSNVNTTTALPSSSPLASSSFVSISRPSILTSLQLSSDEFILLCTSLGNDYAPNIPGVGIKTVLRSVKGMSSVEQLSNKLATVKHSTLDLNAFQHAFKTALNVF